MAQTRKISGVATSVRNVNGVTSVRYYDTDVVRFDWGAIELNSGGYRTVMTKLRMNQASNEYNLGYTVYQDKGDWFVSFAGKVYDFRDGMTLNRLELKSV